MMITAITTYTIKPGVLPLFTSFFSDFLEESKKSPGCIAIRLFQDEKDQDIFYTIGDWESEKSRMEWLNSQLYKYSGVLGAKMLLKEPETRFCKQILE